MRFARARQAELTAFDLIATDTTGEPIQQATGLPVTRMFSGPYGGNAPIAACVAEGHAAAAIVYVNYFDGNGQAWYHCTTYGAGRIHDNLPVGMCRHAGPEDRTEPNLSIIRTRVADDTWVFTSRLYVEVNAGLVVTSEGGILIDTLPFPSETRQIIEFADRICPQGIKYVINTISHADHVYGSWLFPDAELVAHETCLQMLQEFGERALREAKEHTPELHPVQIRLPKLVFSEGMVIRLGGKTVHLIHSPGPSPDTCAVHVREDKVLFASDLMMPVPIISTSFANVEAYRRSLLNLNDYNLECIVQGHGDILLRGEVTSSIDANVNYLADIQALVDRLIDEGATRHDLLEHDIEQFNRSRIPLGGLVQQFHNNNLLYLWEKARAQRKLQRVREI